MWCLALLLKPGRSRWNAVPHQERDRVITQETGVHIRSGCTFNGPGTEYSDTHYCTFCCHSLWIGWVSNFLRPKIWLANVTIQAEMCSIRKSCDIQDIWVVLCYNFALQHKKKWCLAIPSSDNGWLSCILYRNSDKSSWQIFHAVLVETPVCCAYSLLFLSHAFPIPSVCLAVW
jgi:hypothetical protein